MAWLEGFSDLKTARGRAGTAFYAPLGMMSPLWVAFGAAASAGAAFWLMSRWARPVNLEAAMASVDPMSVGAAPVDTAPVEGATPALSAAVEPPEEPALSAAVEPPEEIESTIIDDLTRLTGVGPKIAQALVERGVERFEQLAAWTQDDLAAFDAALDLRGRAIRADFVAQARKLAGV